MGPEGSLPCSLDPILSQPNPVRPIDPCLSKVHLNVILPPTPRSSHTVLKNPQSVFLLQSDRPSFSPIQPGTRYLLKYPARKFQAVTLFKHKHGVCVSHIKYLFTNCTVRRYLAAEHAGNEMKGSVWLEQIIACLYALADIRRAPTNSQPTGSAV